MLVRDPARAGLVATFLTLLLTACGESPPKAEVRAEIEKAVMNSHTNVFDGGPQSAEVVGIDLSGWEKDERLRGPDGNGPIAYSTKWNAKLRFKEPLGFVLVQIDGTKVVRVIAKEGDEIAFTGEAHGIKLGDKWEVSAMEQSPMEGGPWQPLWEKAGNVTFGYETYDNGYRSAAGRGTALKPLSQLEPCVLEDSPEEKAMYAASQERQRKAQEAALAQQRQRQQEAEERQKKQQEEAAEKQRLAQQQTLEKQRLAQEEAKQKAEAARRARLMAVLKPFQSPSGAIITSDAGPGMGSVLLDARIDEENFKVSGRGVDLREMPFREFTFEGSVDERGSFTLESSLPGDPVVFALSGERLASRAGLTIAAQSEADQTRTSALLTLGTRLQGASPVEIQVEVLDASACKTRESQLKLNRLSGTVLYKGKNSPTVVPLFAGDLTAGKAYTWRNKEVVALRLDGAAKGSGLYIRGSGAATDNLNVVINGVHRATIASIPKLGGAILTLPLDLEIFDVRLEAVGAAQSRTIGLLP